MALNGETTRATGRDGNVPLVLYLVPWAFVVLAAIRLKNRLLVAEGGGYDFLANVTGVVHGEALSLTQRLALFRHDILITVVIGGLVFLGVMRLLRPGLRAPFAWVICTTLFLILYAQLKSWWEVGTFISASLMADGLFGAGRELIGEYSTSATVVRLFAALGAIAFVCVVLGLLEAFGRRLELVRRFRWTHWPLLAATGVVTIACAAVRIPATPFDRAATTASLAAFVGRNELEFEPPNLEGLPTTELVARYAGLAEAPVPNRPSPHFGKARDYDVVLIMIESLPEYCYRLALSAGVLPNLGQLEQRAFVAQAHYTTYPYSRRAYSSIFTSWYPLNGIRGAIERYGRISRDLRAPGMVHSTAMAGYQTVAFVPERPVAMEEDELRYAAAGFAAHEVPSSAYERPEGFQLDDSHRGWVRTRDRQSFEHLKSSAASAIDANQRYLYSFNPQVTHGPWPGVEAATTSDAACRAGFTLFAEIDGMIGELTELLRGKGRLDRTLIVVLGDHGLRTRREYPPFHGGTLDDITFHVPMLLYAPGVLDSTHRVSWMTSHIDVAPSVLDLLGLDAHRDLELGSPIWNPELQRRATYFFARGYLGADGFQQGGEAIMVRYLYGGVSRSTWDGSLRFTTTDLLRRPDSSSLRIVDELHLMAALQTELARSMLPGPGRLAQPAPSRPADPSLKAVQRVPARRESTPVGDTAVSRRR